MLLTSGSLMATEAATKGAVAGGDGGGGGGGSVDVVEVVSGVVVEALLSFPLLFPATAPLEFLNPLPFPLSEAEFPFPR